MSPGISVALVLGAVALVFASEPAKHDCSDVTIIDCIRRLPDLRKLDSILTAPGLHPMRELLRSAQGITLFAPNNKALRHETLEAAEDDLSSAKWGPKLLYHVARDDFRLDEIGEVAFKESLLTQRPFVVIGKRGEEKGQVLQLVRNENNFTQVRFAGKEFSNNAKTIDDQSNIQCSNGFIHVIDKLLPIPPEASIMVRSLNLETFLWVLGEVRAMRHIDITSSLTMFVPSEEAWESFKDLDDLPKHKLRHLLLYHLVQADQVLYTPRLKSGSVVRSILGEPIAIDIRADEGAGSENKSQYFVNNASVILKNVLTANGAFHIIDRVLIPPSWEKEGSA